MNIEGTSVQVVAYPKLKFKMELQQGAVYIDINIDGDLTDLQNKISHIIGGQKKYEECGERITVHSVSAHPKPPATALRARVKYQKWVCVKHRRPEVYHWKLVMKERVAKTRLLQQSFDVCVDAAPMIENNKIRLVAHATCADPDGLGGVIVKALGLKGKLRTLVDNTINQAFSKENLSFTLPPEIQKYNPVFRSVRFTDRGNGALGLNVKGDLRVTQVPQITEILQYLHKTVAKE
ncbi:MAG: hypothetical protein GY862_13020 [Gammaproteobacteria bacterium]|nr:hypothetical protein [Gammaproteobacteria bacterium]